MHCVCVCTHVSMWRQSTTDKAPHARLYFATTFNAGADHGINFYIIVIQNKCSLMPRDSCAFNPASKGGFAIKNWVPSSFLIMVANLPLRWCWYSLLICCGHPSPHTGAGHLSTRRDWYGFNPRSSLVINIVGSGNTAALCTLSPTLAASSGAVFIMFTNMMLHKRSRLGES